MDDNKIQSCSSREHQERKSGFLVVRFNLSDHISHLESPELIYVQAPHKMETKTEDGEDAFMWFENVLSYNS